MRLTTLALGIGASALLLAAAPPSFAALLDQPAQVHQWGVAEVALSSDHTYANPVRDVTLTAEFRSPSGKIVHPDGFFDGGHVWRVRLMADEQGQWSFHTQSSDPELSNKTGTFTVTAPAPGEHGPVRVAHQYHFAYADGTPYFLLGTTEYGSLSGGAAARELMDSKLQHSGFNKARFMLLGFGGNPNVPAPFETGPDGQADYTRPNPAYYREVEDGLRDLQALHVQADLIFFIPYGSFSSAHSTSDMGADNDEAYLRYAVARLAAYDNVWWTMANEFDLFKTPKDWNKLGMLVHDTDPYGHLTSIHHSLLGFYDNRQPWITHINIQDITMQRRTAGPRNLGAIELDARKIGKPVMVDEYGYEGDNGLTWGSFSGRQIVNMHWSFTMAGAYGSYGESYAGGSSPDYVGEAPKRLAFLKEVMTSSDFDELEPANDVVSYSGPLYIPTALAKRGSVYLIYFPQPNELADWNAGFFGPATPSNPLPIKPPSTGSVGTPGDVTITMAPGIYKVELIDPWQMTITTLGYTSDPVQKYTPRMTPGVLRLTRVDALPPGETAVPLAQLGGRRR